MRVHRLLGLLFAYVTVAAFAAVPPPSADEWKAITAGEFRIYSNASDRATKDIAANLLRMREAIGKITRLNVHAPVPTYVFIFKNERSFAPYRDALFQKKNASVSGVFSSSRNANFIIFDSSAEQGADRVVYHELTHYFLRNTTPDLPLWVDEGLAEYYSSFEVSGGKISIGRPIVAHVQWLREHTPLPLAEHFAVTQKSPDYSEGTRQGSFYAQSWALIHYLLTGEDAKRKQLAQFLANLRSGQSNDEAFRSAFGIEYKILEAELRAYLGKKMMAYVTYDFAELPVPELSAMRAVTRDELLHALGMLYAWNPGTQKDAELLLQEAIRANPDHAEAHAMLGYLHEAQNDRGGAHALYDKAVALGTTDPTVYILYGHSILERSRARSEVQRARQLFERAAKLDPNNAPATAGICMTYVGDPGDVSAGISACEKSLSLDASQEETSLNLLQLYADKGRRADAKRIFDTKIARSTNGEYINVAKEALLVGDLREAEKLFEQAKRDEAIALIRPILAATNDPSLRNHVQRIVTDYDARNARLEQAKAIRDIVEKAQAGKAKEALAALDALLPKVTDEQTKSELVKMRKELARK
jgi:Tfp pilus assembly protein PilF